MKSMAYILLCTTTFHTLPVLTKSYLPNFLARSSRSESHQQQPMMNIPIPIPGSSDNKDDEPSSGSGDLSISDVIGKERSINIFAGFTRDIDSISKRFNDQGKKSTVLAPSNSALAKLPRKPWEDPEDYNAMGAEAYKGDEGEDRATRNLRRFVEAHIVPVSPWKEGEKVQSLRGETIWWESKDGKKLIQPGNIEVKGTVEKVANGEVLQIQGCLNYA